MEEKLYASLAEVGGMQIPLNPPRGRSNNLRLQGHAAPGDFPARMQVDKPVNTGAK